MLGQQRELLSIVEDYDIDLWWFGALIYVTGCIMINLGSNLIRFSHEEIKHLKEGNRPPVWKRIWWMIGMFIWKLKRIFSLKTISKKLMKRFFNFWTWKSFQLLWIYVCSTIHVSCTWLNSIYFQCNFRKFYQ